MEAVAAPHGLGRDAAHGQRGESGLELGHGLAGADLAEAAADPARGAGRMRGGEGREGGWLLRQPEQQGARQRLRILAGGIRICATSWRSGERKRPMLRS